MEKKIKITEEYLYLPIQAGAQEKLLELYVDEDGTSKKLLELMVPEGKAAEDGYPYTYFARFAVKQFADKTITLKGDFTEAFEAMTQNSPLRKNKPLRSPSIHFTAEYGWINDPNGLVYANGVYHLYFQYNPCNISWNNMSWGHATSRDLLFWEEQPAVLYPDENGMMFSGCGIVNERELLGLPKDALLFFYSAAGSSNPWSKGKAFTQRLAVSRDGGRTLEKWDSPYLDTICRENRDPKVFWHEQSKAYIMVLWLEENDFAILRSANLEQWEQTDRFTLQEAWECPDLVELKDKNGNRKWMFWSADGFYYWGEFDGYHFRTDGIQHQAYLNKVPYAAQTYSGVNDRVISVPWLRIENDGRRFTGAMGIPRELSFRKCEGIEGAEDYVLVQDFVRELAQKKHAVKEEAWRSGEEEHQKIYACEAEKSVVLEIKTAAQNQAGFRMWLNGSSVSYDKEKGMLWVGTESCPVGEQTAFTFVVDDRILEVSTGEGSKTGMFVLKENLIKLQWNAKEFAQVDIYEIE